MHGQFARDMEDKDKNSTWRWMRKGDLKGCTEALITSAKEQSIRSNYIKCNIDKTGYVYWQFCDKLGFSRAKLWYEHESKSIVGKENFKILWDARIQLDYMIEARTSEGIVVVDITLK